MAQFDVHRNTGSQKAVIPYIVVVQSSRFDLARRRVVIPMVLQSLIQSPDTILNPGFEIEGTKVVLNPLQVASLAVERMGERVGSLKNEADRVIASIDLLITRAWQ
jgi:toxin CcdB